MAFSRFLEHPHHPNIHAPTHDSVLPIHVAATQCYVEQTSLNWIQFLGGRVSKKWRALYCKIQPGTQGQKSKLWTKNLILLLWNLSLDIWKYRNDTMHGSTKQEQAIIEKNQLVCTIRELYEKYRDDPYIVPWNQTYLFERRNPR
jgi:hypothetical protein